MKKLLPFVLLICSFQGLIAQENLAQWTFSNNLLADTIQNSSLALNAGVAIRAEGTAAVTMTNGQITGDYALTATGWDNGADVKNWNIKIATTGYDNITLSSKQRSGNTNAGPVNWKVQYKVSTSGTWTDLTGGVVTVGNDWTSGVLSNVALPVECANVPELYIRWIMTSNTGVGGGIVGTAGTSKIDEIFVKGISSTAINEISESSQTIIYPNPSVVEVNILPGLNVKTITIYDLLGNCIYSNSNLTGTIQWNSPLHAKGIYLLTTTDKNGLKRTQKFVIK